MKSSLRTLAILTFSLVILLLWLLVYEKRLKSKHTQSLDKEKQVFQLISEEVQEIEIQRMKPIPTDESPAVTPPVYEKITLKKTGNDWNLTSPVSDAADSGQISSMLTTITSSKEDRIVDEKPLNLELYGLKEPWIRITLKKGGEGKPETVLLGKNTPTGYNAYAMLAERGSVLRISRSLRTALEKPVKDLRKKEVIAMTRDDMEEVEIAHPGKEDFVLKRSGSNKDEWTLARDLIPADSSEWNRTLSALVGLRATDFASEDGKDLAKFGLSKPSARVTLVKGKEKTRTNLIFGKSKDKHYAKRDDRATIFEIDKDTYEKTLQPTERYRNMKVANFNRFDVKRIKLQVENKLLELLKEDSGWVFPTNPQWKVDEAKVDTFLTTLQDMKIDKYLLGRPASQEVKDKPRLFIQLFEKKDKEEKEKLSLRIGQLRGNIAETMRSDLSIPFLIDGDSIKKLQVVDKDFIKQENKEEKSEAKTEKKT